MQLARSALVSVLLGIGALVAPLTVTAGTKFEDSLVLKCKTSMQVVLFAGEKYRPGLNEYAGIFMPESENFRARGGIDARSVEGELHVFISGEEVLIRHSDGSEVEISGQTFSGLLSSTDTWVVRDWVELETAYIYAKKEIHRPVEQRLEIRPFFITSIRIDRIDGSMSGTMSRMTLPSATSEELGLDSRAERIDVHMRGRCGKSERSF